MQHHAHASCCVVVRTHNAFMLPACLLLPLQSVLIGGVARVDVLECPGATLYLSVFASDAIVCHFGKTDGAEER